MINKQTLLSMLAMTAVMIATASPAAEKNHSGMDHSAMGHDTASMKPAPGKNGKLSTLREIPASGRAREAGSDGRYIMEVTGNASGLSVRCAQASRGLIMLDNATWKQCGGKPEGASMGAAQNESAGGMDHSSMDHSGMKH